MVDSISSSTSATTTASTSTDAFASLTEDYQTFLNLLITQLENQDPLSPMDSSDFTNQLVMFAGVEQQIKTNENLSSLISLQQAGASQQALGYLGTVAEVESDQVPLVDGAAAFSYTLSGPADNVKIEILDANGDVVRSVSGGNATGKHVVSWDGTDSNNEPVANGLYTVKVTPTRNDSTSISVTQQTIYGVVNSVQSNADGTVQLTMTYLQGTPDDILSVNTSISAGNSIAAPVTDEEDSTEETSTA